MATPHTHSLSVSAALALCLATLPGCTSLQSPDLTVAAAAPQAVCGAQRVSAVSLKGSGFAPLPRDTFSGAALELPHVTLQLQRGADGSAGAGVDVPTPYVPDGAQGGHVRWLSAEQLSFDVYPGLQGGADLAPGLYGISVTNPDGRRASLPGGLAVVPPPQLKSAAPSPLCDEQSDVSFTLQGAGFVRLGQELPVARFTPVGGSADAAVEIPLGALSSCAAPPAPEGLTLSSCADASVSIPRGALAAGLYQVAVRNPRETGCTSTESVKVLVVGAPTLSGVTSGAVCSALEQSTLLLAGSGFLSVTDEAGTRGPSVTINGAPFASQVSECAAVEGVSGVQLCKALRVTVPKGAVNAGANTVVVKNPPPAACDAQSSIDIVVVPPPTLTSALPSTICAGGGALNLTGTGFRSGASVTLNQTLATQVAVASGQSASATFAGGLKAGGPYDVVLQNPEGCSATLAKAITVTPGPSVLFVDPPTLPSSISTQVTVYGASLTPPILKIEMAPTGSQNFVALPFTVEGAHPNRALATLSAGLAAGSYDVRLTDSVAGTCPALSVGALKIVSQPTLTVTALAPAYGTTAEATATLVGGAGFVSTPRVYLNPTGNPQGSRATAMAAVTYQSATSLSGVVRPGLMPGSYDVLVVNPDGAFGVKAAGFTVTAANAPPPVVSSVAPSSFVTGTATAATIYGTGFRSPAVTLACQNAGGVAVGGASASVTASTSTSISVSLTATGVLCLVTVSNADGTRFTYSAIGVTNSSLNLSGFVMGAAMTTPRRGLSASAGRPTAVTRFIYAVGGDNGNDSSPLRSVEAAATGLDGTLQPFAVLAQQLPAARSFLGVVNVGRFLYAVGGFDGTKATSEVYRAELLSPLLAPQFNDLDVAYNDTQGLAPGQYIYRVAAVLAANDSNNPGGETLASDPFVVLLQPIASGKLQVVLTWPAVANAASYRLYRSPVANAAAGGERLLATVGAVAAPSYVDKGDTTPAGVSPLPLGATGAWASVAALQTARAGAGVAAVQSPSNSNQWFLYAAGGNSGTLAAPTLLSGVELLTITVDAQGNHSSGAWVKTAGSLATARWLAAALPATAANNDKVPAGSALLYVMGGATAAIGGASSGAVDVATLAADGKLAVFADSTSVGTKQPGCGAALVNNQVFAFGGFSGGAASNSASSASLKIASTLGNFNAQGSATLGAARAFHATAQESAFIYQLGGAGAGVNTALASSEQTVW